MVPFLRNSLWYYSYVVYCINFVPIIMLSCEYNSKSLEHELKKISCTSIIKWIGSALLNAICTVAVRYLFQ